MDSGGQESRTLPRKTLFACAVVARSPETLIMDIVKFLVKATLKYNHGVKNMNHR